MPSERYLPTLDGWRALAISLVIVAHYIASAVDRFSIPWSSHAFTDRIGVFGVDIFFAISGFLITSRLLRAEAKTGSIDIATFYRRRFFRLFPAAFVFLITCAILGALSLIPMSPARWTSVFLLFANYSTATNYYNVAHFWSLAVEEHFYLFWPLALVLIKSARSRIYFVVGAALAIAVWRALAWKFQITTEDPARFFGRTDVASDPILWGCFAALLVNKFGDRIKALASRAPIFILLFAFIVVFHTDGNWKNNMALSVAVFVVIPFALIGTVYNPSSALGWLLEIPALKWIGRISYSLYLWQQLFVSLDVNPSWFSFFQQFPVNIIFAFGAAAASYYLIERPIIAFGRTTEHSSRFIVAA
jgi:peptidoglycan/LPS O-acetylase OafA/YrhL